MKKLLASVLALTMAVGMMSACGAASSSAPASKPASASASAAPTGADMTAEITWWTFPTIAQDGDNPAGTYEKGIIVAFNEKFPNIKVNLETIDFTSGPDAITAAIEGNAAPDVLFDAPGRIIEYGKNGKLAPLDDMFTTEMVADINNAALIEACKGNGTAYMYPLSSAPFYMTINEKQWEEAGAMEFVNKEGDRTWKTEDFEKAAKALKAAGVAPGTLFCSAQGGDQGTRAFVSNLYGAQIANADMTEYTMNSEAGIKGLTTAQNWIKDGLVGNGVAYNGGGDIELFVGGSTSYSLCWGVATQKVNQGTLDTNAITTFSLPFPSESGTPALEYLVNGFCVFDNGDANRIAASKELIKFICDDATWGPKNVVQSGAFPVRASFGDLYAGNEEMALLAEWTKYYAPYYNTMDGFANMRAEWWNMLQGITGGDDVKTAVDNYVKTSNEGMKK